MVRLTVKALENLRPGPRQFETAADQSLRVRIYPSGRRTFVYRYKDQAGRQRVLTLGEWPGISLTEARRRLAEAKALREQGADPSDHAAAAKLKRREGYRARAAAPTVADILGEYMTRHVLPRCKPATQAEFTRLIEVELKPRIGSLKATEAKRSRIVAGLDTIADEATPSIADHATVVLRAAFRFAVARGRLEHSPADALPSYAGRDSRERVLAPMEIRELWAKLCAPQDAGVSRPVALALKLLLATAQRRSSVAKAEWSEFKGSASPTSVTAATPGAWEIPAQHTKTGVTHLVPLSPLAQKIISELRELTGASPWLLPNPSVTGPIRPEALTRALDRVRTAGYRLHDLRRTGASLMDESGVTRHVIGRVLGHTDGTVTGIYDRYAYQAEKRRALETLARRLGEIIGRPETARVVALR